MAELNKSATPAPPGGFYARLRGKLGVSRIRTGDELASMIEQRLPITTIKSLVRGGLSDAEVYQLIVPSTWNVLMNPQHPESVQARIVRVNSHGIDAHLLR
jgi:hypothetical protein